MYIDKNYSKPYVHFINDFLSRAKKYNDLQLNPTARLADGFVMNLLQTAVSGVPGLAQLQARERHDIAKGEPAYDFDRYTALLKDEAERLDGLRRISRQERNVHFSEMHPIGDPEDDDDALYQAFKAMVRRARRDESSPG